MANVKWSFFKDGKVIHRQSCDGDTADHIGKEKNANFWCWTRDEQYCLDNLTVNALKNEH